MFNCRCMWEFLEMKELEKKKEKTPSRQWMRPVMNHSNYESVKKQPEL